MPMCRTSGCEPGGSSSNTSTRPATRGPFYLGDQLGKTNKAGADEAAGTLPASLPDDALRDEYAGKGGSYIYDPAAGKRTPVEQPVEQVTAEGEVGNG